MLTTGIVIGKFFIKGIRSSNPEPNQNLTTFQSTISENNKNISETRETAITRAVKKISPAMVGINVEEVREVQDPFSMFDNDPFFKQFFSNRPQQKQVVRGLAPVTSFLPTDISLQMITLQEMQQRFP